MLRRVAAILGIAFATIVLLELGVLLGVESGLVRGVARPSYGAESYWWGGHPELGVWRHPNASFEHRSACFDVAYRTNSAGARDVERERSASRPRVVVLGDSFLEGWGIADGRRLSDRLEAATGIEHLNFAMSHFGPYQEVLAYRTLAKRYDHDGVLIGILPANDFVDSDLDLALGLADYEYRYRPYLVGDPPDYTRFDYRESAWRRALREYSYAFNALLRAQVLLASPASGTGPSAPADPAARRFPSWYYDFGEAQVARLEWILKQLVREAEGRPVEVVLIPVADDFRRQAVSGANPLGARLVRIEGLRVLDLLPAMANPQGAWGRYFLACDYHWNSDGNEAASRRVMAALRDTFYRDVESRRRAGDTADPGH